MHPVLELRDFTASIGAQVLVEKLNVTVTRGEVLGIFGDSGSGKSSLLHLISGLASHPLSSKGDIILDGKNMGRHDAASRSLMGISIVLQDLGLFADLTVYDNIAYPLKRRRWPSLQIQTRIQESLDRFELEGLAHRKPAQLSGGQRQRVAFARALSYHPSLLLLDEPLRGLQDELRYELLAMLRELCRDETSILFVSHDREEVSLIADQLISFGRPQCSIEHRRTAGEFESLQRSFPAPSARRAIHASDLSAGSSGIPLEVVDIRISPAGTRFAFVRSKEFGVMFVQLGDDVNVSVGIVQIDPERAHDFYQRRSDMVIVRVIFVSALAVLLSACGPEAAEKSPAKTLTVVSFGGPYQDAQRTAYMSPFSESTGVIVEEGEYNGEYGLLSQRAEAPEGNWDVVSVESGPALRGGDEGLFLAVPPDLLSGLAIVDGAKRQFSVGHLSFATVLAYRDDGENQAPTTWGDFFDLVKFPGRRGLRNSPRGTLEIALLADGVSPDQLYPLDVDRALRKLSEIRSDVIFWDSGAQPTQLLANDSVEMSAAFNGRIWAARTNDKLPVNWTFNGALYEYEFWAVPRNSSNAQTAFDFIRFSLEDSQQAKFANEIAYLPTNLDAMSHIEPAVQSAMPTTSDDASEVIVDAQWWADNEGEVTARWERWKAEQ